MDTSKININCKNNIQSVELFDVQGRILQTTLENGKTSVINISDKTKGIYFIKVHTDKGIKIEKILKN